MLWNIETGGKQSGNQEVSSENLDLVQILSHEAGSQSGSSESQLSGSKVQGHALTIKDEYIPQLISICQGVSHTFLESSEDKAIFWSADTKQKLFVLEEEVLVKAIDSSLIKNWEDFEFSLSVIIENRLLQLYQSHLDKEHQRKWKKLDLDLLYTEDLPPAKALPPTKKQSKKKKKNKVKKQSCPAQHPEPPLEKM